MERARQSGYADGGREGKLMLLALGKGFEQSQRPPSLLIGLGPDADRRAKLLICQAVKGALLDAFHKDVREELARNERR
jgi:hypothetical protein